MTPKTVPKKPLLKWSATEHTEHERSALWYLLTTACIGGLIAYSVIARAWTFTVLIIGTAVFYWYIHNAKHTESTIEILEDGVRLDGEFTSWEACSGFWILRGHTFSELHIETKNRYRPDIKIQTGSLDPDDIHTLLRPFLTEYPDRNENILDTIIRICKL